MPNHSPGWNLQFISKNFTCPEVLADVRPESACSLPASPLKRLSSGDELCGHLVTNVTEYPRALKSPRISPPQGSAGGPNSGGEAGAGAGGQGLWGWALSPRRSGGWPGGGVPRILWGEHAPASGARAAVRVGAPAATSLPALSLCPAPGQRGRRRGPAGMPASRGAERARRKDSREGGWGARLEWVAPRSRGRLRRVMEVRTL